MSFRILSKLPKVSSLFQVNIVRKISNTAWKCSEVTDFTQQSPASKRFNFIADAAQIASPAVVYIEVKADVGYSRYKNSGQVVGSGSGFAVTDYGIVMTNAHVVDRASSVDVRLQSGEVCIHLIILKSSIWSLGLIVNVEF